MIINVSVRVKNKTPRPMGLVSLGIAVDVLVGPGGGTVESGVVHERRLRGKPAYRWEHKIDGSGIKLR